MLSRLATKLYFWATEKETHYLDMAPLVVRAYELGSSKEKIASIKSAFEHATDEVKLDKLSKKYVLISDDRWLFTYAKGLAVNYPGRCNFTLAYASARSNDIELAKWLIEEQGADLNAGPYTPLMVAAEKGYIDFMTYLISQKVEVNFASPQWVGHDGEGDANKGTTALHRAVRFGQVDSVKFLLQHGALLLKDERGETPLDRCRLMIKAIKELESDENSSLGCKLFGNARFREPGKIPSAESIQTILDILVKHSKTCEVDKSPENGNAYQGRLNLFGTSNLTKSEEKPSVSVSPTM